MAEEKGRREFPVWVTLCFIVAGVMVGLVSFTMAWGAFEAGMWEGVVLGLVGMVLGLVCVRFSLRIRR